MASYSLPDRRTRWLPAPSTRFVPGVTYTGSWLPFLGSINASVTARDTSS